MAFPKADIRNPEDFDAMAKLVRPEKFKKRVLMSPDLDAHTAHIQHYIDSASTRSTSTTSGATSRNLSRRSGAMCWFRICAGRSARHDRIRHRRGGRNGCLSRGGEKHGGARTPDEAEIASSRNSAWRGWPPPTPRGHPHVVPVCYAWDGARFVTPLDEKPKRVGDRALRRVRNIEARHEAALVIDRYDDDWSRLGYLLVQGRADLMSPDAPDHAQLLALLRERYPQYRAMALETRPLLIVTPSRVTAWGPALEHPVVMPPLEPSGRGIDFLPLARGRRSVRAFQQRAVPRAALETMIEAARSAARALLVGADHGDVRRAAGPTFRFRPSGR